jgi:hypothetical protein
VQNGGYASLSVVGGKLQVDDECCERHLMGILADTTQQAL